MLGVWVDKRMQVLCGKLVCVHEKGNFAGVTSIVSCLQPPSCNDGAVLEKVFAATQLVLTGCASVELALALFSISCRRVRSFCFEGSLAGVCSVCSDSCVSNSAVDPSQSLSHVFGSLCLPQQLCPTNNLVLSWPMCSLRLAAWLVSHIRSVNSQLLSVWHGYLCDTISRRDARACTQQDVGEKHTITTPCAA
jgi:hypothetical protein